MFQQLILSFPSVAINGILFHLSTTKSKTKGKYGAIKNRRGLQNHVDSGWQSN